MKKLILAIVALFTLTIPANAMSYEQARQQALFLADKMAYELNLTEAQYEAVYEINLDYLMSINNYDDLYGVYWRQRNMDLSYILLDWQYRAYCAASYFYRPLYWDSGYWHFAIYARYPHRSYLYFGRPTFWTVYRGGHSWRMNGGRSWYHGRNLRPHHSSHHSGMRDHFDRNKHNRDFGRNNRPGNQNFGNRNDHKRNHDGFGNNRDRDNNRGFGKDNNQDHRRNHDGFGNNRDRDNNRGFGKDNNQDHKRNHDGFGNSRERDNNRGQNNRTFGNGSDRGQNNGFGRPNSPSTRESSTRTTVTNSDNRRFNGTRGGDVQSRPSTHRERPTTTTPSSSSRNSFGGSSRSSGSRSSFGGGSHSSGSRSSFGGGSHSGGGSRGGGHFGGRR